MDQGDKSGDFAIAPFSRFPQQAAASGHNCLQIDTSGYVTNTGSPCGAGGGTPAGSSYAIQYNNGGSFGGASFTGLVMNNGSSSAPSAASTTGSGVVVLAVSPALSGTATGNNETLSGTLAVGTSSAGAFDLFGTFEWSPSNIFADNEFYTFTATPSGARTIIFPDASGTVCLTTTCTGTGNMSDGSGSSTAGYFPATTSTAHTYLVDTNIDDGVTTASTVTVHEALAVNASSVASQISLTYNTGHALVPGSSTTVVSGPDASGKDMVSEGGGTAAERCNTTNGVCASPVATIVSSGAITVTAQNTYVICTASLHDHTAGSGIEYPTVRAQRT